MMRCLAGLVALALSSTAWAGAPPAGWQRVASPDGRVSAMMPCTQTVLEQASEGDGFRIVCKKGGVMFILTSGMRPVNGGAVVTFDAQLAKSRGALPASERIEGPMFGYRALKIVCAGREQVPCIELIDYRPDRPLMVAAIDVNGPGTAAPADLPAILEQSRLFYDTVEVRKP